MFSSGAMFGTQATQGFSMGGMDSTQLGDPLASQAAAKKPRQEVKETCLPVTLRAVEVALEKRGESGEDLKFYGCAEPQMVLVVAAVESVARSGASLEVVLNDATGRMKGRWFLTDPKEGDLDRIVPGAYVSAFGEVRASPVQHLALKGLRPVDSVDEVSYHMVEVAHAALQLQKAEKGQPAEPATPAAKDSAASMPAAAPPAAALTPEKPQPGVSDAAANPYAPAAAEVAAPAAPAAAAPQAAPAGAELRAAVLAVLRDAAVGPEGLHMDAIVQKAGAGAAEVKAIVAELVDDGDLYSTITEEHFAAV